jgi:hypothetical protein
MFLTPKARVLLRQGHLHVKRFVDARLTLEQLANPDTPDIRDAFAIFLGALENESEIVAPQVYVKDRAIGALKQDTANALQQLIATLRGLSNSGPSLAILPPGRGGFLRAGSARLY